MKIRLHRGSIRFRLRQGEVRALIETGRVVETLRLGGSEFCCSLGLGPNGASVSVGPAGISASIPRLDAEAWASGQNVGVYYPLPEATRLMVEKDWACMEPTPGESNDDTFPRPTSG
jgi:hypothetical protein